MAQPICRFFQSPNGCARGSKCTFAHTGLPGNTGSTPVCRFYASASGCQKGMTCPFSHDGEGKVSTIEIVQVQLETLSTKDLVGPFFAVDVECVATGYGPLDRAVGRIAVVDGDEKVVFDSYVQPAVTVVSCLTQLTGLEHHHLENAPSLDEARAELVKILPKDSVIVGQSVTKDIEWIGLVHNQDYKEHFDVAQLFRAYNGPKSKNPYRYYSLRHVVKYLMDEDIQKADHDPIIDAKYAMRVFHRFRNLHDNPSYHKAVLKTLSKTPRTPPFSELHPVLDGVAMSVGAVRRAENEGRPLAS